MRSDAAGERRRWAGKQHKEPKFRRMLDRDAGQALAELGGDPIGGGHACFLDPKAANSFTDADLVLRRIGRGILAQGIRVCEDFRSFD